MSGRSADVRELEASADAGDDRARLSLEMFVDRAAAGIGGVSVALRRLDALVFTGGIGEHAGQVRTAIVERLAVLDLGPIAPDENGEDRMLVADAQAGSADDHKPVALRIEAREDLVIARAVTTMVASA